MKKEYKWIYFYCCIVFSAIVAVNIGSQAVSVMAQDSNVARNICVVIDPGHGGEDGGAVSCSGIAESKYNLEISLRLRDMLHLLGYQTKLTRTRDVSIYTEGNSLSQKKRSDLKERLRIVRETDGAILISIHQNHYPDSQYHGAQVFYANTAESEQLAGKLQAALISSTDPNSHRQIQKSRGVYLMEHINCPGALIECGFLSNQEEEVLLRSSAYQKKLSAVIASALGEYLSNT